MISYYKMNGRFGNMLKSIYTVYYYCKQYNIDEQNIVFNGYRFSDGKDSHIKLANYIDFFVNIRDKFVDESLWKKLTKGNICATYVENTDFGKNITFKSWIWKYCGNDDEYELFGKLFYNKELFDSVINKCDLYKDRIAIHIRRTDFLRHEHIKPYVYTEQQCQNLIDENEKYIVFSDDVEWCRNTLKKYNNCIFMDKTILKKDWEHFIIMCCCKKIIRQYYSSFSTSAGYINSYLKMKGLL